MAIFGLPNSLYTLFATQNLPKFWFSNALGNIQSFQENLKTILYAKQREGTMGDSKSRMRTTTRDRNSLTDFASNVKRERLNLMKFSAADRMP